jgi:1-phosphofructokinase family hexose kinase
MPNPCFDAIFFLEDLVPGSVHRSLHNSYLPGGKGINVARVAKRVGSKPKILVMLPKVEGELFKELLALEGHDIQYLDIDGVVRQAIAIYRKNSKDSTVVIGKGPDMKLEDWESYCELVQKLVRQGEMVTLMGSLNPNFPTNALEKLSEKIRQRNGKFLVDTSPASYKSRGSAVFDFITPNLNEAETLLANASEAIYIPDNENIKERSLIAAEKLFNKVSKTVIVTAGAFGVALKSENLHKWFPAFKVSEERFKSSVGAGDAFVAGFATQLEKTPDEIEQAIRFGMATAAAQCETFEPGILIEERVLQILNGAA